jgi:signal transduction histidine kinase
MELSTKDHQPGAEEKLAAITTHAPIGFIEINKYGDIIYLNNRAEVILTSLSAVRGIDRNNFFEIFDPLSSSLTASIRNNRNDSENAIINETYPLTLSSGKGEIDKHIRFTAFKIPGEHIVIYVDDVTADIIKEKALQQVVTERTIMQGKFEITANVLHDIGNALVGFGSYLNRIKRSLESDNASNLLNLVDFFNGHLPALTNAIGEAKANAVLQILGGIAQTQKGTQEDINTSITEQQNIISHIQEILNIHRQYNISGHDVQEKKSMSITSIIKDCMSMLLASFKKRDIAVSLNIPEVLPAIQGDRTRLMQVILNILKNATEAIEVYAIEKSISLSISIENDMMFIRVKDSGNGFNEETGRNLFKRGFTTKSSGSGLGLSSCKAIIESHNGTIDITSEGEGKGALTTIKLKIQKSKIQSI